MTAQEYKAAFAAGRSAFARREPTTANPYRPGRVHPLDPPPDPHKTLMAAMWLRGWQKGQAES